jgi:DNA-binding IclR family transcriptional regulator
MAKAPPETTTSDLAKSGDDDQTSALFSSFLRSFAIVEAAVSSATPLTLDAICAATGLPKSTVHRVLHNLVGSRILAVEVNGRGYSAGDRLHALLSIVEAGSSLHRRRREIMMKLVDRVGHTCNFTTLALNDVVYVDRVEANWPGRTKLYPGSHVPVHCTSTGKLLLSFLPARQRRRLLFRAALPKYTDSTVTDPISIEKELRRIRRRFIATDEGGYLDGMVSVAVPVFGQNRRVIGGVAVHARQASLPLDQALSHLPDLKQAARDLGTIYRRLG